MIRNFVIISHIDHGKSTLADRLLELTGTVLLNNMRPQYLDMMDLEREKGITIKMQPVYMKYVFKGHQYFLNLIDTPGHVDFFYEVSRSLAAVEGAVLLVDASKGIQAQTIGNLELAKKQKLVIIPVINKIDLPYARIDQTEKEISDLLDIDPSEILKISAKENINIEKILEAVIEKVPPPSIDKKEFQALIFDSKYDQYKGVTAFVRIFGGEVKQGDKISLIKGKVDAEVKEVGIFTPRMTPVKILRAGEIGYLSTGVKEPGKVTVGETIGSLGSDKALEGYQKPKPMIFLSIYPENYNNFELLKIALEKLNLNDASLTFKPEMKEGLGRGFQCGFLGLLHAEIIVERLKREFGLDLILSTPSVVYKIIKSNGKEDFVYTCADWPKDQAEIKGMLERWTKLKILTPMSYLGKVLELLETIDAKSIKTSYFGADKSELIYETPLREIISKNFYDKLKSVSQGFASIDYELLEWRPANLVKMDVLILERKEEALSRIVPQKEAEKEGRKMVQKLKELLPKQLFSVPLQAAIEGKIIARETMKANKKDVIASLYGGDYSRKRKLLEKQKKGKKELKQKGRIKIPPRSYLEILGG